ncbi:MAG: GTP-binding protein, partial [Desulfurococcaceae archaeon]|nr:GTP-binding protein [Desulfurococcaceae archaeon]
MHQAKLRSPIVTVLGHVDHGKTTLLDRIRGTAIVKKEPGEMTQHVGASFVPLSVIEKLVEPLKKLFPIKLTIPGLLFIDTPGHEIFANLRRRGGAVA